MTTAVEGKHRKQPAQKSFFQRIALPVIIILAGLMVLMYPVVATQWNNRVQEQVAKQYEEQIQEAPPEQINQALEAAKEYNRTHTDGPILDPWLARISEDNLDYQEYEKHLEGVSAMSQLAIPSIDLRLPVYTARATRRCRRGSATCTARRCPPAARASTR